MRGPDLEGFRTLPAPVIAPAALPRPSVLPAEGDEAACAHCGLPLGDAPVAQDGRAFCCTGCAVVYTALAEAGLDGAFYRVRALGGPDARPARAVDPDAHVLAEMDTPRFLAEETSAVEGGARRVTLFVDGVHCAACVWLAERLPTELDGVSTARLDLAAARLTLTFDPLRTRLSDVAAWLARFGYDARPARQAATEGRTAGERRMLVKMGVAWALAGNAMLLAFAFYSGMSVEGDGPLAHFARYVSLALATGSVLYAGPEFFRRAWASMKYAWAARSLARLHMDVPISLGILVGYGQSAFATVSGRGEVWFDSIMVLTAALLTSRYLQLRARRLAGEASDRLLSLVPALARRLTAGGSDASVDASDLVHADELAPGDRVLVQPGEVVPVDGVVLSGASTLDNAVLTGESRPEAVEAGQRVEAGATNLTGALVVTVEAAGGDTRVGKLLAFVREADAARAPTALLADRLGGWFVGIVLVLAAVTFAVWLPAGPDVALHHVVALLVISCPCALGMATPLAFAVGAGRAARAGLFVKREDAFEALPKATAVVLDKTGTLTEGRMALVEMEGDAEALVLAAVLERTSLHPIARALERAAPQAARLPDPDDVVASAGDGLAGWVGARYVRVGRPAWVLAFADDPDGLAAALDRFAAEGLTPVAVAVDDRLVLALGLGDALRPDARAFVERLGREGRAAYLLSGDHPDVAARVGAALGLPPGHVVGGASPEDKRAFVERLAATDTVVMVGDGVNDAAALQAAHVGVSVGGGALAARMAAPVFALTPGLAPLERLFDGARRVVATVRVALALSFAYNVLGALAAMAGLVTPLVAAVAMPLSSLAVIALAIGQRSFRTPPSTPPGKN